MGQAVRLSKWILQENSINWAIRSIESLGIVFDNIDNKSFPNRVDSYTYHLKDSAQTIVRLSTEEEAKLVKFRNIKQFIPSPPSNVSDAIIKGIEEQKSDERYEIFTNSIQATVAFLTGFLGWRRIKEPGGQIGAAFNFFGGLYVARRVLQSVDNLKKLDEIKQEVLNDLDPSEDL